MVHGFGAHLDKRFGAHFEKDSLGIYAKTLLSVGRRDTAKPITCVLELLLRELPPQRRGLQAPLGLEEHHLEQHALGCHPQSVMPILRKGDSVMDRDPA